MVKKRIIQVVHRATQLVHSNTFLLYRGTQQTFALNASQYLDLADISFSYQEIQGKVLEVLKQLKTILRRRRRRTLMSKINPKKQRRLKRMKNPRKNHCLQNPGLRRRKNCRQTLMILPKLKIPYLVSQFTKNAKNEFIFHFLIPFHQTISSFYKTFMYL